MPCRKGTLIFDEVVFVHPLPRLNLVFKILTAEITNGNGGKNELVFECFAVKSPLLKLFSSGKRVSRFLEERKIAGLSSPYRE